MAELRIAAVGDSPATYVCAIYLYTSNLPVTVVRAPSVQLASARALVAGCPGTTPGAFAESCCEQARNMGIEVVGGGVVGIKHADSKFHVITGNGDELVFDVLAVDRNVFHLPRDTKNLFVMEDLAESPDAIVIAGAGCKAAFAIKEVLG